MFRKPYFSSQIQLLRKILYRQFCKQINMPSAIVLLAEGAEEMETVISVDVLRRGGVSILLIKDR